MNRGERIKARVYIESNSIPIPFTGCWLWLRSTGSHGYGNAFFTKATVAHRVSYFAFNGEIPENKLVQHVCDNRWCVNPDHLLIGTDWSNANDKVNKGRAAKVLNTTKVITMRELARNGFGIRKIGRLMGVSQRTVQHVIRRKTWKHVADVSLDLLE